MRGVGGEDSGRVGVGGEGDGGEGEAVLHVDVG